MFPLLLLSAFIGVAIGLTGIGGILAIPGLIALADLPPRVAMGTVPASLFLTSIVGILNFRAMGVLDREVWKPLCVGGFPSTFAGAWLNSYLPSSFLLFLLGLITILAGVGALHTWKALSGVDLRTSPRRFPIIAAVGGAAGLMAGLTGAGGPVLSIPVLIALGLPPLPAVVSGMPFQLATSVAGSAGNILRGQIDFTLLVPVAVAIAAGTVFGNRIAPHIPARALKITIGVFCLIIGAAQCLRAF